ncbi:hypothetical protein SAMN05216436_12081 [bacterium A37T11]|nr:hypothetical protein SAMN05216436_12081 [bacterium A37T11]
MKATHHTTFYKVTVSLFAALWGFAALSKLTDIGRTRIEMDKQVFSKDIGAWVFWIVPCVELIVALLLAMPRRRRLGLQASLALMSLFSGYFASVLTGVFGFVPCFTVGIFTGWGHGQHLLFNMIFVALATTALVLTHKNRQQDGAHLQAGRKEDTAFID